MPIYSYQCECGKAFDKFFATISKGAAFIDKHKCECGKSASRVMTKAPTAFFKGKGWSKPMYSSNANPDKE